MCHDIQTVPLESYLTVVWPLTLTLGLFLCFSSCLFLFVFIVLGTEPRSLCLLASILRLSYTPTLTQCIFSFLLSSFCLFQAGSTIVQSGPELAVLLRMALKLWSSCPHLQNVGMLSTHHVCFSAVVKMSHRALCMLSRHSTNWTTSPFLFVFSSVFIF